MGPRRKNNIENSKKKKSEFSCGALAIAAASGTVQKKMTANRESSGCRE